MKTVKFLEQAKSTLSRMIQWRRDLHQIPEEAFREVQTTQYLMDALDAMGVPYRRLDPTGLVAEVKGTEEGPCIALRADIDALAVKEETGLAFASRNEGFMHACGHDVHMACALGAIAMMKDMGYPKKGTVRIVFQPAEELGIGADHIIPQGVLDGVCAMFGLHVFTGMPAGCLNLSSGPRMAGSANFEVKLTGKSGHGSSPYQGIDVIPAGSAFVMNLQSVPSREVDSRKACVVSVGTFHAGTRYNVIAGEAEMLGTCRCFDLELREELPQILQRILDGTCAAYRVKGELNYHQRCPIVINDENLSSLAQNLVQDMGISQFAADPLMLSEDFASYGQMVPALFAFLGGGEGEPNHNSRFMIDENCMVQGAAYLAACAVYKTENP